MTNITKDLRLVFEPYEIKGVRISNRIVRSSQGSGHTVGGFVGDASIAWHLARARGGVGLLYSDPASPHWSSPAFIDATTDQVIEGLRRLTTAIHAEGARMFTQIMHGGPTNIPLDGSPPWSASHAPDPGLGMLPIPMTQQMIDEVVTGFAEAAVRLQAGGIDGVELHGGHGYLFSAFLSPATNRRNDAYNGDLRSRTLLLRETLSAVRDAVGLDYPVGVRLSPDGPEDQSTIADTAQVAQILDEEGLIDFVNLSFGSHYQRDLLMGGIHEAPGYQAPVSAAVRARTDLPVIATGRMFSLADAETMLETGNADLVSMVRATIADPDIVNKTRQGHLRDIRPCIACNQACAGGLSTRGRTTCTVNPAAGREQTYGDDTITHAEGRGHLVVVGGGPGGMEAARVGALAGYQVTLLEAEPEVGGQLRLARRSPHRAEIANVVGWWEHQLSLLGVEIRLSTRATADDVIALHPAAVVVASGAMPRRDGFQTWLPGRALPGLDSINLLTGWDVLAGTTLGERVLLVDEIGHYESLDVAEALVESGHKVEFVTRFSSVAANLEMRWEMIGAVHVVRFLKENFELHARSLVVSVSPGHAQITPLEARHRVTDLIVDSHVMMSGSVPERSLAESLQAEPGLPVRVIGDANGPRLLEAAVFEGNHAVRSFDKSFPRRIPVRFGQSGSAI